MIYINRIGGYLLDEISWEPDEVGEFSKFPEPIEVDREDEKCFWIYQHNFEDSGNESNFRIRLCIIRHTE